MGNIDPAVPSERAEQQQRPSVLERALRFAERRHSALALVGGLSAIAATALLVPPFFESARRDEGPLRLGIVGAEITEMADGEARALAAARKWLSGHFTFAIPGTDEKLTIAKADLGIELDRAKLKKQFADLAEPASLTRRALRKKKASEITLPAPVSIDIEAMTAALYRIKDRVDRSPQNARINPDERAIVAEIPGRWLDIWGTLARIEAALLAGQDEIEAAITTKPPRITQAELATVQYDEVLGFFETRYSTSRKYEARTYNLWLAASKLDGHVLFPGDEFDFNEVVGPRDEANGYKVATVIAQGELVDGIGGGTCQIAGSLHGAAMFSGLEIVERRPHTRPSSYIKMGLDAAVVYPTITLKIRNPFPYPVVLRETVQGGVVRAEVLGPKGARKTITYFRKIDGYTPFQEMERPDPKLPKGVKTLAQRGIPGFRLRRYRLVRDGAFAERERWNDFYPPTTQIIRVGTGDMPKDSVKIADDPHPEYVADVYLMMMQGPEVENAKGMIEVREAGESGRYGWTERAGFSHWSPGKQTREGEGEACLEVACARPSTRAQKGSEKPSVNKSAGGAKDEKGRALGKAQGKKVSAR